MTVEPYIEPEIIDSTQPFSEEKAKELDAQIRKASEQVVNSFDHLIDLLEQAALGQIHVALGYKSWTAYVKDAVKIAPVDRDERKALAELMSGKGMSNRTIAAITGVSEGTVRNDLADADTPEEVTGLDGKTYKKRKPQQHKESGEEPLDVEEVDEDDEPPTVQRRPITGEVKDVVSELKTQLDVLAELAVDPRFENSRKTIAKNNASKLREIIDGLTAILDSLEGE